MNDASESRPRAGPRRTFAQRVVGIVLGLAIALSVVFAVHYYFWVRLILEPAWPAHLRTIGSWSLALGALALIAYPFAERLQPPRIARFVVAPASVWMAACFYLLLELGVVDAMQLVVGSELAPARTLALILLSFTLAVLAVGAANALRGPVLREVELSPARWPKAFDGYRVVQISDLHISALLQRSFAEHVVRLANEARPDLVAVTGDLVDGSVAQLADEVAPLADLVARDGVFFVAGNHDHYSGVRRWLRKVEELGMHVLRNSHTEIARGAARFVLAGVDDPTGKRFGGAGDDVAAAISGAPQGVPVVLLAHDPRCFDRAAAAGVALQLSGHTHGGQMWPFAFVVRLSTRFLAGRYTLGASQLYVSRGTGFWGPPIRMFARSELTVLVLRSA